jgi:hypothetical protein
MYERHFYKAEKSLPDFIDQAGLTGSSKQLGNISLALVLIYSLTMEFRFRKLQINTHIMRQLPADRILYIHC